MHDRHAKHNKDAVSPFPIIDSQALKYAPAKSDIKICGWFDL